MPPSTVGQCFSTPNPPQNSRGSAHCDTSNHRGDDGRLQRRSPRTILIARSNRGFVTNHSEGLVLFSFTRKNSNHRGDDARSQRRPPSARTRSGRVLDPQKKEEIESNLMTRVTGQADVRMRVERGRFKVRGTCVFFNLKTTSKWSVFPPSFTFSSHRGRRW